MKLGIRLGSGIITIISSADDVIALYIISKRTIYTTVFFAATAALRTTRGSLYVCMYVCLF